MNNLLLEYIDNPTNPHKNMSLGDYYQSQGQWASATTHFLKAADNFSRPGQIYHALLATAKCFKLAGGRHETMTTLLKRCIALAPRQPEAYLLLLEYYELNRAWHDCYMLASIAEKQTNSEPVLDFPGHYAFTFYKGVAAWWIGNTEESKEIMHKLWENLYAMNEAYRGYVLRNIRSIGHPESWTKYTKAMHSALKNPFPGSENIERNYSQVYQDMFALAVNKGKRQGTFLEIGCADPFKNNNTYLLEKDFGWKGISIDKDFGMSQRFRLKRPGPCYNVDALDFDYETALCAITTDGIVDYLQIDCDPPEISFEILKKIPFDKFSFNAITFEHDYYINPKFRDESRKYLKSKGYELAVSNICFTDGASFEDWWVHPRLRLASPMKHTGPVYITGREYTLNEEILKNFS